MESESDQVESASYKRLLSQDDQVDTKMLSKGVLVTNEDDIRKITRKRCIKGAFKKVLADAAIRDPKQVL